MKRSRKTFGLVFVALATACSGDDSPVGPTEPSTEPDSGVLYVDATSGSDDAIGDAVDRPFRTLSRAIAELPSEIRGRWTIHLAEGRYEESIRLWRFIMPSDLAYPQLADTRAPAIALEGEPGAVIAPTTDPCIDGISVAVFLRDIECRAPGGRAGLLFSGSSIVLDDVSLIADSAATSALYLSRTSGYLGGRIDITGPFSAGLSIRETSFVRSGTSLHPDGVKLTIDGPTRGIFLRDLGTFTATFAGDSIRIRSAAAAVYALFHSTVFLPATSPMEISDIGTAFFANHQSGINIGRLDATRVNTLIECLKQSYVILEIGTYTEITRDVVAAESCQVSY